jgi:ABC-type branched-subunit amino acid transport system ATPase component
MNPEETRSLANLIAEVREKFKVTILLIEHHMDLVMNICSPIVVMNFGTLLARGTPDEVRETRTWSLPTWATGRNGNEALCVEDLNVHYGTIHAVQGVSFPVEEGEIVSIVGSNGPEIDHHVGHCRGGQTIGRQHPDRGKAHAFKTHEVVSMGLALVPERRRLFSALSVRGTWSWSLPAKER